MDCLSCVAFFLIVCSLLHVKNQLMKSLQDMSNSWELEMEKNEQFPVPGSPLPPSTPIVFLLGFLSHRCGHSCHSLWVNVIVLAAAGFLLGTTPPTEAVFKWLSRVASRCPPHLSLAECNWTGFPRGTGEGAGGQERHRQEGQQETGG